MPKSHVILASLLIAASAAAPSGVYIPSATSSNSIWNQNANTQPQSQSRFKSVRAESSSEKPVIFGRPDKWGRHHSYNGKSRKSHKKRISYWGVPAWDGMNPLNALGNSWIYKRNHSPSRHSRHFSRSPKFNKRSPMPVDDPEPLTLPLMAGPPLLPNGPNTLTNPLDGLTPPDVANATATVVDGGSGSPLVGEFNGGVAIGTVVRKRERSYPDTSSQRVMETSHDESEQGLGLGVGLELGLGLGGYREDDRTFSYEQDNPHDNAGDDNQAGNHPHARPAASPSKPIGNNHPKPNHGNEDIREDIHEHIHKHIHSSKRDGGADVPGTVDIVSMQNNTRIASLVLGIGSANGTSENGNTTEKVFVLNASETNRTTVYLVPDSNSSSTQSLAAHGSGDPSSANHTIPVTLRIPVFDTVNARMAPFCFTYDLTLQPSPLTLDACKSNNTQDRSQEFEYSNESGVVKPLWKGSNTATAAAPSNSTGGGMLDVELVFVAGTPEVRPIEQDPSNSTTTTTTSGTSVTTSSVAPSIAAAAVTASAATSSETPSSVATSSSIMSSAATSTASAAAAIGFESASLESTSTVSDTSATAGSVTSTLAPTTTTTKTNVSVTAEDAKSIPAAVPSTSSSIDDSQADPTITSAPTMTTYSPDPNNTARTPITINESEANAAHESANKAHTHIRPNTYTQSFGNVENGYSASARLPPGGTTETATPTGSAATSASTVAADGYSASAFVPLGRSTRTVTWHTSTDTSVTGTASAVSTVAEEGYSASAFVPLGRSTNSVTHWHISTMSSETGTASASASATVADVEATEMASSGPGAGTGRGWWGSNSAAPSASASGPDQVNVASSAPTNSATDSDPESAPYDNPAGASSTWDEWSAGSSAPTTVAAIEDGPDSKPTVWVVSSAAAAASSSSSVAAGDFSPNPGPWPTPSATSAIGPNPDFVDALTATATKSGSTYVASSTSGGPPTAVVVGDVKGDPSPWPSSSMPDSQWPSPSASANTQANDASNPTSTFTDTDPPPTGVPPSSTDMDAEAMTYTVAGVIEDHSAKDNSGAMWTGWIGKDKR